MEDACRARACVLRQAAPAPPRRADEPPRPPVVWLEAYLSMYNHILVITSHSQDFMDSVCTNIMDLTPKKKLVYYTGNYRCVVVQFFHPQRADSRLIAPTSRRRPRTRSTR